MLAGSFLSAQPILDLGVESGYQIVRDENLTTKLQYTLLFTANPGVRIGDAYRLDLTNRLLVTDWSSADDGFIYNAYWGTSTGIRVGRYVTGSVSRIPAVDAVLATLLLSGNWIHYRNTWLVSFYPSAALSVEALHSIGEGGIFWSAGAAMEFHLRKDMDVSMAATVSVRIGYDLSIRREAP